MSEHAVVPPAVVLAPERPAARTAPVRRSIGAVRGLGNQGLQALAGEGALGPGRPLDPDLRRFFEDRLGVPLAAVRLHTGDRAAEAAEALGAHAYTVGRDVVFGSGRFAPGTGTGRRLLAHELAHVAQQQRGRSGAVLQRQVAGPAPDPGKLPGCRDLLGQIRAAVAELLKRAHELVTDPLGLQWDHWNTPKILPGGTNVGSVAGHQHQYEGWRNRLRNLIAEWDDDDCNSTGLRVPQDARELVFRPVPTPIPRPRPSTDPQPWEGPGARRVAAAARGAAIGAGAGLLLGGLTGGLLGAGGGTLVAPGFGTIGGGAAGALAGAEAGAGVGAAVGAAVGGLIGWLSE